MNLVIKENIEELIDLNAQLFINAANEEIAKKGKFSVALSGGSSPKKMFELLANNYPKATDWTKIFFFFGDERYVPANHPDSNALMAKTAFLEKLNIPAEHIFEVNTNLDPQSAALAYSQSICHFFDNHPIFDLILLGLGDDGHTASLFPHTPILWIDEEIVKEVYLADKEVYRISITAPLINDAKRIAFLTFGENKAHAVQQILEGERDIDTFPAQLIKPCNGVVYWFIDTKAASLLK